MAYNATYNADDISESTIDGVVKFVIAIAGFATLIGLVLLYGWAKKKGMFSKL